MTEKIPSNQFLDSLIGEPVNIQFNDGSKPSQTLILIAYDKFTYILANELGWKFLYHKHSIRYICEA